MRLEAATSTSLHHSDSFVMYIIRFVKKNIPFLDENIPYLEGGRGGSKSLNEKNGLGGISLASSVTPAAPALSTRTIGLQLSWILSDLRLGMLIQWLEQYMKTLKESLSGQSTIILDSTSQHHIFQQPIREMAIHVVF